jgi:hypothetical protein
MVSVLPFQSYILAAVTAGENQNNHHMLNRPKEVQLGLNFIRFYMNMQNQRGPWINSIDTQTAYVQPENIFNDFSNLGIHAYRQFIKADLLWDVVEPRDNEWNFSAADRVIRDSQFEPIPTLFALQYSSPTAPWSREFSKALTPDAIDYVQTVVRRYGPYVRYWEIGNEMEHWRIADPKGAPPSRLDASVRRPRVSPVDGFSPREQGKFLAEVAKLIRKNDPDALILMPGMGGLNEYSLNEWFRGILEGGGKDWFDIVNYHYYSNWESFSLRRRELTRVLREFGINKKPVWCTETGSTSDPTLPIRTNYPNSPASQAADIFRRLVQAYGHGDAFVAWHTYIGSPSLPNNRWRLYGILSDSGVPAPSYYSFKLLGKELIPFDQVELIRHDSMGECVYKFLTKSNQVKYVAWGRGSFTIPPGITAITSVIPDSSGNFGWRKVRRGEIIPLLDEPMLFK